MTDKKRIPKALFIFTEWSTNEYRKEHNLYGGIGYYRIVKPAEAINATGKWKVDVAGRDIEKFGKQAADVWSKVCMTYDVIFTKHIDSAPSASNMLALAKHFNTPVVFDLDDNYLQLRQDNPAYEIYTKEQKKYIVSAELELGNGIAVSTEPLKEAYGHLNPNIDVLPNCNDLNDWKHPIKKWNDDIIRIGYAGSITHNSDLAYIINPLKRILDKYPNVTFEMLGAMQLPDFEKFRSNFRDKSRIKMAYGTPAWEGYPKLLLTSGWDIGICPLMNDEFNRGKSHIKWMEYTMGEMAVVASDTYPYTQPIQGTPVIEDGKTGLLAHSKTDWYKALSALIENKTLRKQLATNAYDAIAKNWQYSQHADKWVEALNKYIKK